MQNGWYTGVRLSTYGTDGQFRFRDARAIINLNDRAEEIALLATRYREAMRTPSDPALLAAQYLERARELRRAASPRPAP